MRRTDALPIGCTPESQSKDPEVRGVRLESALICEGKNSHAQREARVVCSDKGVFTTRDLDHYSQSSTQDLCESGPNPSQPQINQMGIREPLLPFSGWIWPPRPRSKNVATRTLASSRTGRTVHDSGSPSALRHNLITYNIKTLYTITYIYIYTHTYTYIYIYIYIYTHAL